MKLSLFSAALLLLAAGSDARSFRKDRRQCAKRQNNGTATDMSINPQSTPSSLPVQKGITRPKSPGIGLASADSGSPGGVGPGGQGNCPGFRNVVFNTGAPKMAGWPETTWGSLVSHGVNEWIGFSLDTLDKKQTYNTDAGPAKTTPDLNAHQINMAMDPADVTAAVELLKNNPPEYLGLFNEPDYSFMGFTPITDAVTSAKSLQPLFDMPHPKTTYIAPAPAFANSDWLKTFRDNCNNCFDQISIMSQHIYSPDPAFVLDQIRGLHATWPDKKIWITELAPSEASCTLDQQGVIDWMNKVIPEIQALGYVEKVFWNCGEKGNAANGMADGGCNPSLTNEDGSPTELLLAYGKLCGGGSPPTQSAETS